jgi:hypothetical protein
VVLAACLGAVALGFGLYAIQALPFWEYVPHSPRAATGPSTGWEYAIAYSLPPEELMTPILPQFNGMVEGYWGRNFFKLHTEYLGPLVVMLAIVGIRGPAARPERQALLVIAALFLLVSLGGHTPFYRLWYEVMPMMKKVRAAGMAFVLVALPVAVFAGLGADRVLGGQGRLRGVMTGLLAVAVLGLLGAVGGLQGLAESLASQATIERAIANAPALRTGGLRLLAVAIAGLAVCFLIHSGKLVRWAAAGALLAVVGADLWSIQRHFFVFGGTEQELFGDDEATAVMRRTAMPFRVLDPHGDRYGGLAAYPGSWLMGREIPQLLGYHGQELHRFDELLGGKSVWENQVNPALLSLFGIRYVVLPNEQAIPGFHKVLGPVRSRPGGPVVLYEADTVPPYARLMSAAVKAPAEQIPTLVTDPRFPALQVALYDESAPVSPQEVGSTIPAPPTAQARVAAWSPGRIRVTLEGSDQRTLYLLVAENWYRDWRVAIDGGGATALPAHGSMLSVPIPPGSREVDFEFRSDAYRLGRLLTLLSALIVAGLLVAPRLGRAKDGG